MDKKTVFLIKFFRNYIRRSFELDEKYVHLLELGLI